MLKILGGQARGRHLKSLPKTSHLRPILARVKKSLFDILRPNLHGSRFLDLYAGTGAVGLEALSRGAATATFVEYDRPCAQILEENIQNLGFEDRGTVFTQDILSGLTHLPKPYDVIFLGPPYKDLEKGPVFLVTPTLQHIFQAGLLGKKGLVIAQHHKKEPVLLPSGNWTLFRQERYGDTVLSFIKWK